ncbi:4-hydroxy-tetrahydrodipicolinate synthase [Lentibacillus saliphilus]|uniref:4-hydroxy-tetrahydrodipicolinate synthase n=1 Tax=Lentibacillus saliphilus TaxID=2737028 RepID=UPI001C2FCF8C|nr:4-hydroxy-tetrahydrodipicolinate synthase [Lentibacillus saliphilus]
MEHTKLLTAMVTPFNEHGELSFEHTAQLIEHLIATGSDGLVVAGTTGESATLTTSEKLTLFEQVVQLVRKRVPVIAATGSNDTAKSIQLTKQAEACDVDGVMLVTPYYNKPCQEGLYSHFSKIAEQTSLPIMLYNIPGRSAIQLEPDTIIDLSRIRNIVALKQADHDLTSLSKVITHTSDDFLVYCGEDSMTLPMQSLGAHGVVSVASHIIGRQMKAMIQGYEAGQVEKAAKLHHNSLPLMEALFAQPSPAPVKAALQYIGIETGSVRLPLKDLSQQQANDLTELYESVTKVNY